MSHHRFPNMREMFNADLKAKVVQGIQSRDFTNLECNCRNKNETGCDYENLCRDKCNIYNIECKITHKHYIGSTQQTLKARMQQHHSEVQTLIKTGEKSDTFAAHFARILHNFPNPSTKLMRNSYTIRKVWQANPVTCVPTFGTPRCHLCNHEKLALFHLWVKDPGKMINNRKEITSKCRHKPKFHRFVQPEVPSTDEHSEESKM